jgi:AraC family transcriptional regulator of adaptative response / DNA-3-methyladenine glycosylase II
VNAFGPPIATPYPALTRLFPSAAALAHLPAEALGQLGIVRQRQNAILALARAVADRRLQLCGGALVHSTVEALRALPGIGDWTAQYIAMRALRWPDAFPAADVALHKALGVQQEPNIRLATRAAEAASQAWKPWRSYAVLRAWAELPATTKTIATTA